MAASKSAPDAAEVEARVRAYLDALPAEARSALRRVRAVVRKLVPAAVEHFSYGIPGFRFDGQPLVWYAAFKSHFSLYPMSASTRRAYAAELEGHVVSTGTIRFPLSKPVPVTLITKLVKSRAAEAKAAARKRAKR